MKFQLIIDPTAEEAVTVVAHSHTPLADSIQRLLEEDSSAEHLIGYRTGEMRILSFDEVECIFLDGGKSCAAATDGEIYHLKARLYELEEMLPGRFVRLNKSAIGALNAIECFKSTITGAVDAVFRSGHVEYISRRCFSQIKRRLKV